jgi:hypothetical protein
LGLFRLCAARQPFACIRASSAVGTSRSQTSRTATSDFTNVLTSIGPQNLFTRLPIASGMYDWIDGLGRSGNHGIDFDATSAKWEYRLTFGVERIAVPEPAPLALLGFGLNALFVRSRRQT